MRFSKIILAYFVMGSVMWGAGVIAWEDAGIGSTVIEQEDGEIEANDGEGSIQSDLLGLGGPISSAVNTVAGGALLAVWQLISGLIGFIFWPVTVLMLVNAPSSIVVTAGGSLVMIFVGGTLRIVRGSA
jgi:hypothetical protein